MHVLVVGQQGVCLRLEEVDVPDAQKGQQHGHVCLQRSAAEVLVLQRPAHDSTETPRTTQITPMKEFLFKDDLSPFKKSGSTAQQP